MKKVNIFDNSEIVLRQSEKNESFVMRNIWRLTPNCEAKPKV